MQIRLSVIEVWECEWWRLYKTTTDGKQDVHENFPYRRSLTDYQLQVEIKNGKLFSYVQCDLEVHDKLKAKLARFPSNSMNSLISKNDIGNIMKTYAEDEGVISQPQKTLIWSFTLQHRILIPPLLLFKLQPGIVVTKLHRFVGYSPKICFKSFVAVDARRISDENPNTSVVAETIKLLGNSSCGSQNNKHSRHTVTIYLSDERTHGAFNSKLFKKLHYVKNSLYENELANAQI